MANTLEHFDKALECEPRHEAALNRKGFALIQLGDHASAVKTLQLAFDGNPDNFEGATFLGYAHLKLGDARKATAHLEHALRVNPDDEQARNILRKMKTSGNGLSTNATM